MTSQVRLSGKRKQKSLADLFLEEFFKEERNEQD